MWERRRLHGRLIIIDWRLRIVGYIQGRMSGHITARRQKLSRRVFYSLESVRRVNFVVGRRVHKSRSRLPPTSCEPRQSLRTVANSGHPSTRQCNSIVRQREVSYPRTTRVITFEGALAAWPNVVGGLPGGDRPSSSGFALFSRPRTLVFPSGR